MTETLARTTRVRNTRDWLIPLGLIALSLVPVVAGASRVASLATGVELTPDNARFVGMPLPVILHIVGSTTYCLLGAFQFQTSFRRRHPRWHRLSGRILIPMGLVAALSGLWMTAFYALPATDGGLLPLVRWVFGLGMVAAIALGVATVLRREFAMHRAWMIRAYAIGIAAGTQVFTTLPWVLAVGAQDATAKTITMTAGWILNLAVAEWIIRRRPTS
ncbi:DUF2306 domain-containing protein [Microbacterium sp. zg.B48]|uniref:DUF2306 domain-containing protein n=1 Tax=Microbacterium sp. zg.B48 TaxID=2969408 RepID=UPI00214AA98F|nr:DUF2306 domain-containing protein [Microbacterium sp. zg.B48]MCR2762487.1 DUF2306 domain-containing protein [Microbacterium sp. zg.B48]